MKSFSQWDFTLQTYEALCRTILGCGYSICTVAEYVAGQHTIENTPLVVLRHDVDRKPVNALRMATLESGLGIRATYYFRACPSTFSSPIMKKIYELGHEVGYHYECLSSKRGDAHKAIKDFAQNLGEFRKQVPIKTICMHGSPLSPWDNRDLWNAYNFADFDIIGEPYLSIDYGKIVYLSDTGRSWHPSRFSIRDNINTDSPVIISSTYELIALVQAQTHKKLLIQSHPERWNQRFFQWMFSFSWDLMINWVKVLLVKGRIR